MRVVGSIALRTCEERECPVIDMNVRDEHERTPLELASNYMGNGVQEILTTMQATSRKRALERLKTHYDVAL